MTVPGEANDNDHNAATTWREQIPDVTSGYNKEGILTAIKPHYFSEQLLRKLQL